VTLVAMGVTVAEACVAHDELTTAGIGADLVVLTSADLIFRALRARQGLAEGEPGILETIFPADRAAPMVTVLDGHPHALSFLSAVNDTPLAPLGVDDFGQSGDVDDLYRYFGIDPETIVGAAADLLP
jgi:pyruvate dehydrogenase E1 component